MTPTIPPNRSRPSSRKLCPGHRSDVRYRLRALLLLALFLYLPAGLAQFAGGDGTRNDPWRIATAAQLDAIRHFPGAHFRLVDDIDFGEAPGSPYWNEGKGWEPIHFPAGFTGTLDGNGHYVSRLYIDRPGSDDVGLFEHLGAEGWILDLTVYATRVQGHDQVGVLAGISEGRIEGSFAFGFVYGRARVGGLVGVNRGGEIHTSGTGTTVSGEAIVGGLAGANSGLISASTSSEMVSGEVCVGGFVGVNDGTIYLAHARAGVSGLSSKPFEESGSIGGLAGVNSGSITHSLAVGTVNSHLVLVGGLVGMNEGSIDDSIRDGNTGGFGGVGGLAGANTGRIGNSYALGWVTGSVVIGGLVGLNADGGLIADSYAAGPMSGEHDSGGLVGINYATVIGSFWDRQATGQTSSAGGTGLNSAAMQRPSVFLQAGWDFATRWGQDPALNGGYPYLRWRHPPEPEPEVIRFEGILSGLVSGEPGKPALVDNALVRRGTRLQHVTIGTETVFEDGVVLGAGVRFLSNATIPTGLDLTPAFAAGFLSPWQPFAVVQLDSDVLREPAPTLVERITAQFPAMQVFYDNMLGQLRLSTAATTLVLAPVAITQAAPAAVPGLYVDSDGMYQLVTHERRRITAYPMLDSTIPWQASMLVRSLEPAIDSEGRIRVSHFDRPDLHYYVARPGIAVPARSDGDLGLRAQLITALPSMPDYTLVYLDAENRRLELPLHPVPLDWQALGTALWRLQDVTDVSLDERGEIFVRVGAGVLRGRIDHVVHPGGPPRADGSVNLRWIDDRNGDGRRDALVTYPNGHAQVIHLLP